MSTIYFLSPKLSRVRLWLAEGVRHSDVTLTQYPTNIHSVQTSDVCTSVSPAGAADCYPKP